MRLFRILNQATAALSLGLFTCLLLAPQLIFALFAMEGGESAAILARRAAMLFLGLAMILWQTRNFENPEVCRAVAAGLATTMLSLAGLGLFEFLRGSVGPGIGVAMVAEIVVGVLYLKLWIEHLRK